MTTTTFGIATLVAVSAISAWVYSRDHRARRYAGRTQQDSPTVFAWVYQWIRLSTPTAGIGALAMDSPICLRAWAADAWVVGGSCVALAGLTLFLWAKRSLGQHYSPCFDVHLPEAVVQTGPYRWIRHPIYTANLVILGGFAAGTGSLWIVANTIVLWAFYERSARREEAALCATHAAYASYRAGTGRFLPR